MTTRCGLCAQQRRVTDVPPGILLGGSATPELERARCTGLVRRGTRSGTLVLSSRIRKFRLRRSALARTDRQSKDKVWTCTARVYLRSRARECIGCVAFPRGSPSASTNLYPVLGARAAQHPMLWPGALVSDAAGILAVAAVLAVASSSGAPCFRCLPAGRQHAASGGGRSPRLGAIFWTVTCPSRGPLPATSGSGCSA